MSARWTTEELRGYYEAVQSLKLYRRAELMDESGTPLIRELYVDPLPNNAVLDAVCHQNTTFLIGRKGTGKSTVFQRAQHDLRSNDRIITAYIDIKTVYESSQTDFAGFNRDVDPSILSSDELHQLMLYQNFLRHLFLEIESELEKRLNSSFVRKVKEMFTGNIEELTEDLRDLLEKSSGEEFVNAIAMKKIDVGKSTSEHHSEASSARVSSNIARPNIGIEVSGGTSQNSGSIATEQFSDVLIRFFNLKDYIVRLKQLLARISVRHLYIFIDDFSELPEDAMRIVVDTVLSPLNNWSDEFVKLKVAAYPGRVYYGSIDPTKIDEIHLDMYDLYRSSEIGQTEENAIDFTKRIVNTRLQFYSKVGLSKFTESDEEEVWRHLFYATFGNPRIIGYVLYFIYEGDLNIGRSITVRSVKDAALRYYDEKIESFFRKTRFLHESFQERSSIFALKELLESIVARSKQLRNYRDSELMKSIPGRPPTSHFHIVANFESLLSTLELNFFLTKYDEVSDKDGRKAVVMALNYGLCQKHSIEFGRPMGRQYRNYFVQRIFDYSPLVESYLRSHQEIKCDHCSTLFELEKLDALKTYGMLCPSCKTGKCIVTNLSKKYESEIRAVSQDLLLPPTELGILHTLHEEQRPLFASDIATELDCSYQLVGKRGKILAERELVMRSENEKGRRQFAITPNAEAQYFQEAPIDELQLEDEENSGNLSK